MAAVEEAIGRVRLDEEAFAALDEAEPHGAVNGAAVPRYPEVLVGHRQPDDPVIAKAVVLRQHDLDRVAAQLKLATKPEHHIAQAARLRNRGALARDHHHEHTPLLRAGGLSA